MKGLYTALLAFTAVQATPTGNSDPKALNARAVDLKVQYYKDGGCSDYAVSIWPGTSNSCYGYSYSNTNSANIVTCGGRGVACTCYMFEQDNCKGSSVRTVALSGSGSACVSNWGKGYRSMKCYTTQIA
ncbi:uncharacterized protein FFB14_03190 [Fusarium fujikuroi]|nr:uncharacterized protein FFB14_03190 [Fusarium fujikuroi]